MRFSVTIPAYKSQFLKEAIESVAYQTYQDWELIIVDDCSPENLYSIVKPYLSNNRIHYYLNEKNIGAEQLVDNWNNCLNYCKGEYVICMGDDDRLLPCCLEELNKLICKYPNLIVYHSQTEIIDESGQIVEHLEARPEREDVLAMMKSKWKGRRQFLGDYCYNRKQLIETGGFYYLPFAWGSDDITAFRSAFTQGIANTSKVGFQYRENLRSISLSYFEKEKVSAVLLQREWYENALNQMLLQGVLTKEEIFSLIKQMNLFIHNLVAHHIRRDIIKEGFKQYKYWCNRISMHKIPFVILTKFYFKSIIYRWKRF